MSEEQMMRNVCRQRQMAEAERSPVERGVMACPFCGKQPEETEIIGQVYMEGEVFPVAICRTQNCVMENMKVRIEAWQQRED